MSAFESSVVLLGQSGNIEIFYRRGEDASIELISVTIGCEAARLEALPMLDAGLVRRIKQWVEEKVAENLGNQNDHL